MKFHTREVVVTEADPVPPLFRVNAQLLMVTAAERQALERGDAALERELRRAIDDYDRELLRKQLRLTHG